MKRLLFAFVFLFVSALSAATVLVKDGKPQGAIILGSRPTRAAQFAALELQYWISKITGAQLPIRAVPQNGDQVLMLGPDPFFVLFLSFCFHGLPHLNPKSLHYH